jgi:hypothetical protein
VRLRKIRKVSKGEKNTFAGTRISNLDASLGGSAILVTTTDVIEKVPDSLGIGKHISAKSPCEIVTTIRLLVVTTRIL